MKRLPSFLFLLSLVAFPFVSCEKKCWQANCSDEIYFQLIDKSSQQDLVFGLTPRYRPDSMQLNQLPDFTLGHHENYLGSISGDNNGLYTSTGNHPVETSYLRLTYTDIDTITINYTYEANKCCNSYNGYGKISGIQYNGKVVTKTGGLYKFEKE